MDDFKLEDVFGLSRHIPLTYTKRENVDNLFEESLRKKNHIVIFGCSKQGKTCLRKKYLPEDGYIVIQGDDKITLEDINRLILNGAGFKQISKEVRDEGTNIKSGGSGGAKFLSFVDVKAEIGVEKTKNKKIEETYLQIDLSNTNDVIENLRSLNFTKFILIEDFHYLNPETQKSVAFALKAYYDNLKIIFVIIGVWKEENRLTNLNRDLIGRTISINADNWSDEDLVTLIEHGCQLLNIKFEEGLIQKILNQCFGSVYFVQELCYSICKSYQIKQTVKTERIRRTSYENYNGELIEFDDDTRFPIKNIGIDFKKICVELIVQHSAHYSSFLVLFDDINDSNQVIKLILLYILRTDPFLLIDGIKLNDFISFISQVAPANRFVNRGNLMRVLKCINYLQLEKGVRPNIIDFDESTLKINIIEKGFLIWINSENKGELENVLNYKNEDY